MLLVLCSDTHQLLFKVHLFGHHEQEVPQAMIINLNLGNVDGHQPNVGLQVFLIANPWLSFGASFLTATMKTIQSCLMT